MCFLDENADWNKPILLVKLLVKFDSAFYEYKIARANQTFVWRKLCTKSSTNSVGGHICPNSKKFSPTGQINICLFVAGEGITRTDGFCPSSPRVEHLDMLLKTKCYLSAVPECTAEDLTASSWLPSHGMEFYLFILLLCLIFDGNKIYGLILLGKMNTLLSPVISAAGSG